MSTVSVIIPAFNRPDSLLTAVESVLAQTYNDFELIVVDDGSTESLEKIETFIHEKGHFFICSEENRGVSAARNMGVSHAKNKWLAFLDSDDQWLPKKLETQMDFLEQNREIKICQTAEIWYRKGVRVNPKKYHLLTSGETSFQHSLRRCAVSPSSVIIDRKLFLSMGGFDERLIVCEDYELWLRITAKYPVGLINEKLIIKFGGHADQLSRSQPAMDRFRLFALVNLIIEYDLTHDQMYQAFKEIVFKSEILYKGAIKRGNPTADLYSTIKTKSEMLLDRNQTEKKVVKNKLLSLRDQLLRELEGES